MPSQQEMLSDLQAADAAGDTQLAQHIAATIKAQQGGGSNPVAGMPDLGQVGNDALAGGLHFVHQLPLVGDTALTGARLLANQVNGEGGDWQNANNDVHTILNSASKTHPVSTTVGGLAGGVDAALAGGELLKGASTLPVVGDGFSAIARAAQLRKGETLANLGRLAAVGGAQGAAQGGGEQAAAGNAGQILPAAIGGGLMGAAAGAAGGGAVMGAGKALAATAAPLAGKVANTLAKVFGEDPGDLQSLWNQHIQETGRPPSMTEMATYKQLGVINDFKNNSTTIADALNKQQAAAAAQRSTNMQATFATGQGGEPTAAAPGQFENFRTAQGDKDYPASRAGPDFHIPTQESDDLGGVSPADHMASEILPQAGIGRADRVRILNGLQDGRLSAEDAQMIRSGLSESLSKNYSPAVKGLLSDFDSFTHAPGNEASSALLDRATNNFATLSRAKAGAEQGATILGSDTPNEFGANTAALRAKQTGTEVDQGLAASANDRLMAAAATPQGATALASRFATDDNLHAKMTTVFGSDAADALKRMGEAETRSAKAIGSVTGGAPKTDDKGAIGDVAQVGMALASHGLGWKLIHAAKAVTGLEMPAAVQEKVAQYLTDPNMVRQGINLISKAGASASQLRSLALTAAAASGTSGGDVAAAPLDHGGVTIESVTPSTPAEIAQAERQQ